MEDFIPLLAQYATVDDLRTINRFFEEHPIGGE